MPESFIDQLREISQRQGKPFNDPTRIEGFGEGAPPAPPMPEVPQAPVNIPTAAEMFGGEPIEPVEVPEAPPVPRSNKVPDPDLVIVDRDVRFKEHQVQLTDREHGAVCKIALKALKRDLDQQYDSLKKIFPSRKVRAKTETAKPKRGRPRKVPA